MLHLDRTPYWLITANTLQFQRLVESGNTPEKAAEKSGISLQGDIFKETKKYYDWMQQHQHELNKFIIYNKIFKPSSFGVDYKFCEPHKKLEHDQDK